MSLRLPRRTATRRAPDAQGPLELRPAGPADLPALRAVAQRDSASLPPGPLLLAEVAGIPIAAIGLEGGELIADPFWPTAVAQEALRAHAPAPRHRRPGRDGRPGLRRRAVARRRLVG